MNIYEKMSLITAEISAVAKNLEVGFGQSKYKAVGEADVLAAVKPIERKHGVYSYPVERDVVDSGFMTNVQRDGTEKKQLFMRLRTVYRFVNIEKPEEFIDIATYGDGVDSQDKAPGKAMTYADKYALLKAYKIITGDDPDQYMSGELKNAEKGRSVAGARGNTQPSAKTAENGQNGGKNSGYPSREEMLTAISGAYPADSTNYQKLIGYYQVLSLDELSDAQVMAVYNKIMERKR